jgi:putative transposase
MDREYCCDVAVLWKGITRLPMLTNSTGESRLERVTATKSVAQRFYPSERIQSVMRSFQTMVNDCIRIGLKFEEDTGRTPSMRKLSLLSYHALKRYEGYSMYRLNAISRAAGIISSRKKSIRRGFPTRIPYLSKPGLVSSYGFKIEGSNLIIHISPDAFESIPLNRHTLEVLTDSTSKVRSFTLSQGTLSLCISKEVQMEDFASVVGVDRNLRNVTVGNEQRVTQYDVSKIVEIAETTRSIVSSFKRKDVRVGRGVASKYGRRRSERIKRIIHKVTKDIVRTAKKDHAAIVLEDIKNIRSLYQKGNGQGPTFRSKMNSIPWGEIKRQVEYKAAWEGIRVVTLTRGETGGTSIDCPQCGERLQAGTKADREHYRMLWCQGCARWADRDVIAVVNISRRGRLRFDRSEGEASEAVNGNPMTPVILRVDASKPTWPALPIRVGGTLNQSRPIS